MQTTIRFLCYHCRRVHTVDSTAAGRRGRCLCGTLMMVPDFPPEAEPWRPDSMPVALPADEAVVANGNGFGNGAGGSRDWDRGRPGASSPENGIQIGAPELLPRGTIGSPRPQGTASPSQTVEVERRIPESRNGARRLRARANRTSGWRVRTLAVGVTELLVSLPVLAWAFLQTFHEDVHGWREFREGWSLPEPDYLSLPPAFWSTVLFALFLTLFVDGWRRLGRRRLTVGR